MGSVSAKFHLRHHNSAKILVTAVYLAILAIYLFIGFQPDLTEASADIRLSIPSIQLTTPVKDIQKDGATLTAPATIAGAYTPSDNKVFLIGHSSTIFQNLHQISIGDPITYDGRTYTVTQIETKAKADIAMTALLRPTDTPTLILMTCAGQPLGGQDYCHRLIVTAIGA